MIDRTRTRLRRAREARETMGLFGAVRSAFNWMLVRWGSMSFVHVLELEADRIQVPVVDERFTVSFLTPDQVRRFAEDPSNGLSADFADRAERGFDVCCGVIVGERLASYGWYALHSVEPDHAAGAALGLPRDMAYVYKGFTHPDFRGQRLFGACTAWALKALHERFGVNRLLGFVYWSNTPSLASCVRLGFERLGVLVVRRDRPMHVPSRARRLAVRFGEEAEDALRHRLLAAPGQAPGR